MTKPYIIGIIGEPGVGKSTALSLLSDVLWEDGYKKLQTVSGLNEFYRVPTDVDCILVDNLVTQALADTYKMEGAFLIYLRLFGKPEKESWYLDVGAQPLSINDNSDQDTKIKNFRHLAFMVRDFYNTQIKPKLI